MNLRFHTSRFHYPESSINNLKKGPTLLNKVKLLPYSLTILNSLNYPDCFHIYL